MISFFFFFNDTATTEIYTLSLHDALPISELRNDLRHGVKVTHLVGNVVVDAGAAERRINERDRKSTRLNSSHGYISYAVFCLKKKKKIKYNDHLQVPNKVKVENIQATRSD